MKKQNQINHCELGLMKKLKMKQFVAAGIVLAGLALAPGGRADVEIFLAGGNASQNIIYDRITNILSGGITSYSVSSTNSTVRRFVGTIASGPGSGLGTITIDTSLLGAVQGLQDVGVNSETLAAGGSAVPTVAVSSTSPGAVAVNGSVLTRVGPTLVAPYAYVKKSSASANLAAVTNLTARQAQFLEANAGLFPSAALGGSGTNDTVYFVGRNLESAVRTEIDANINFSGTISSFTTNSSGAGHSGPQPLGSGPEQRDSGQGVAERADQHHRHAGGVGHRLVHAIGLRGRAVFDSECGKRHLSALVLRELLLSNQRGDRAQREPIGDYQFAHWRDQQLDFSDQQFALYQQLRTVERHAVVSQPDLGRGKDFVQQLLTVPTFNSCGTP